MKKASPQWGLSPGEKRAALFICAVCIVGWSYLQIRTMQSPSALPLTTEDTAAINAIRQAATAMDKPVKAEESADLTEKPDIASNASQPIKSQPLDINTASQKELEGLPGIGPKLAAQIIETRRAKGKFNRIEDLLDVPGIGDKKLQKMRPLINCPVKPAK
jgi:comEA protein